jgi:hypothetical protein
MPRDVRHTLVAAVASVMVLAPTPGSAEAAASETAANRTAQRPGKEGNMVEATPRSESERAAQPQGQSELGAGESVTGDTGQQTPSPAPPVPPAGWVTYINSAAGFSITYPKGFVVQPQDVSKFAQFTPTPVTSIFFMNPTMAAGALAGIEPPDLEVRVYRAGAADSLRSWLVSAGFASVGSSAVQPYQNASVSGLEVCQATLIAPGCSVYVLHSGRVYQLTPMSREGEAMSETFAPLPSPPH